MRTLLKPAVTVCAWALIMGLTWLAADTFVTPLLLAAAGIPS